MPAIVTAASAKGGCGKTTAVANLACELGLTAYRVALLDADANQHLTNLARKIGDTVPAVVVLGGVTEDNLMDKIGEARGRGADIVLIDLPGGSHVLGMTAIQASNAVLIPSQVSLLDVRDAIRTDTQVKRASQLIGRSIARRFIWTRVSSAIESRGDRAVREQLEQYAPGEILMHRLMELSAFRNLFLNGVPPRQDNPKSSASKCIRLVSDEVVAWLASLAQPKAAAE